jgi:hypothetical protein
LKAPDNGDDATVIAGTEGGPSEIEEITEDQIWAKSPQEDAEADVNAERAEV